MTWASTSGNVNVYIDGAIGKTFSGIAQGSKIPAGGTVVLGQVRGIHILRFQQVLNILSMNSQLLSYHDRLEEMHNITGAFHSR